MPVLITVILNVIGVLGTATVELVLGVEDLEVRGRVETIHTASFKIGHNIEKSPGDLLSLKLLWETTG